MMTTQDKIRSEIKTSGAKTCRVLIVDDHQLFRDGLKELIETESDIQVCGEAHDEESGFTKVMAERPNLVTVDISLASGSGLSLVSRIKKARPETMVLMLSMFDDRIYAERALAAGASGYVCKQSSNEDILAAFRTVRSGKLYLQHETMQRVLNRKVGRPEAAPRSEVELLSVRELEIFTLIGRGRTTHQIADDLKIAVSTVETYRERLKLKLNLGSGNELSRHAFLWVTNNT
jgi:DNA-binding NarL/FixJ family response regulator